MEDKKGASNKSMDQARATVAEENMKNMAAKLIEVAGPKALADAIMPEISEFVRVQFVRDYSFGGLPGPRKNSFVAAPFSVAAGEIADLPKDLHDRLADKYDDARPLFTSNDKDWKSQWARGGLVFDPEKGKHVPRVTERKVDELKKVARTVGLPKSPQV